DLLCRGKIGASSPREENRSGARRARPSLRRKRGMTRPGPKNQRGRRRTAVELGDGRATVSSPRRWDWCVNLLRRRAEDSRPYLASSGALWFLSLCILAG